MEASRKIEVQLMRPSEILRERERCPLVYLPLGPLEWHGPHLPLGVDPIHAQEVAVRLARKTGGVVLPTLYMGTERERSPQMLKNIGFKGDEWIVGMDFPGNSMKSLYFTEEVFAICIRGWIDILVSQGYRLIVLLNGHGAENQVTVLDRLAAEYSHAGPAKVLHLMPMPGFVKKKNSWAHAAADETSVLMAAHPESVDLNELPPRKKSLKNKKWAIIDDLTFRGQPTKDFTVRRGEDPRLNASVENGEDNMEAAVRELSGVVKKHLRLNRYNKK